MPEGPELLYMAEFINNAQERVGPFVDVSMSALATHPTKHPRVTVPFSPFSLQARSRGKELIITIKPAPAAAAPSSKRKKQTQAAVDDAAGSSLEVLVRAGMSGNFLLLEPGEEMPKHAHLRFHSPSGHVLYFQDVRRFGCWRPGGAWGLDDDTRGPCIIQELDDVVQKIQLHLPSRAFARPICELMMNQSFFNGMGNYLRAEILHRAKIHPFSQARAVLMDAVKRQHDGRPGFFSVCEQVLAESVALLRKHGFADDEERTRVFEEWLQCYMKLNKGKDALGRTIWFGSGLRKARAMAADAVAVVKLTAAAENNARETEARTTDKEEEGKKAQVKEEEEGTGEEEEQPRKRTKAATTVASSKRRKRKSAANKRRTAREKGKPTGARTVSSSSLSQSPSSCRRSPRLARVH